MHGVAAAVPVETTAQKPPFIQLRFKLTEYYSAAGSGDEVTIGIPKGGYASRFERRQNEFGPIPENRTRSWVALLALIASALFVVALIWIKANRTSPNALPKNAAQNARATNPEAQELYLQGRYYWNKRTPEGLNKAVDYFTQAIVRDPSYAPAYSGLADSYNLLREYTSIPASEAYPKALAAAKKAVELDDSLAEAHNSLAFASLWGAWDVATADREFKRALELNPANARTHHWYATYLLTFARFPESVAEIERARQLDPVSTAILADKGLILFYAGRPDKAIALLKQIELTEPSFFSSHRYLAAIHLDRKNYESYLSESHTAAILSRHPDALEIVKTGETGWAHGGAQAMFESMLQMETKLYTQERVTSYDLAATCALLGKKQAALEYLHRAYDRHDSSILDVRIDHRFLNLHSDPAYRQLVSRLGLPPLS